MPRASISSHCSKFILLVHLTAWFTRNAAGLLSVHRDDVRGEGNLKKESEVWRGAPYLYLAGVRVSDWVEKEISDSELKEKPSDVFINLSKLFSSGTSGLIKDNAGL